MKKTVSGMILTLLLLSMLPSAFNIQPAKAAGGTIYIRADGSVEPATAPILNVGNVYYTFTADIYESIVVERNNIVVDGDGYTLQGSGIGNGFHLSGINNVTIRNVEIKAFNDGIRLDYSSNNILSGNNIANNDMGILLWSSSDRNTISNNICSNNRYGIYLWRSPNNNIINNNISNNENGIRLFDSSDTYITGNNINSNNGNGIMLSVSSNIEISDNKFINNGIFLGSDVSSEKLSYFNTHGIEGNTINGRPIYYYKNTNGISVPEDAGSVILADCNNVTVENINASFGTLGIELAYTRNSTILYNEALNKVYGIYLHRSFYNNISNNNALNSIVGIYLHHSSNNNILNNSFSNHHVGIRLYTAGYNNIIQNMVSNSFYGVYISDYSDGNKIHHNNFIENSQQACSYTSRSIWDNGYPSGGNYWSDYEARYPDAEELDGSGIWDTPYVIDENNQDRYPLMNPWTPTPPPPPTEPLPASFTYSPSPPYNPVIGQTITFEAVSKWDIVNYHWNFGDGTIKNTPWETTTHSYNTLGSYKVTLTVTNREGATNTTSQTIVIKRPAVVLVHGWQSEWQYGDPDEIWSAMKGNLSEAGFNVYVAWYAPTDKPTNDPIQKYAENLDEEVNRARYTYEVDKVDIVAHSMGGLVTRWFMEVARGDKHVRKLIMLETPNHGIQKQLGWIIGLNPDIYYQSPFLQILNRYYYETGYDPDAYPPVGWLNHCYPTYDVISSKVHYEIIGGLCYQILPSVFDLDYVYVPLSNTFPLRLHSDLIKKVEVISWVRVLLLDDPQPNQPEEQDPPVQFAPLILDKISPNEQESHEILISSTSQANFILLWSKGDLTLILTTPTGTLIDASVAEIDPDITYYQDETVEGYSVKNPESGVWKVTVTAVNIIEEEDYMILTLLDTNITLSLELQKYQYEPDEPIYIQANVTCGGEAVIDASIAAKIQKPDGIAEVIMLYDDGLHGDDQADDGVYANTYTNTSLWGTYDITVTGFGTFDGEQFARGTFATVWVEQYPDLALSDADIHFSNENPYDGETITIDATIRNIGEADANNASILFYDGNPVDGTPIGKDVINVTAGEAKNASIQWTTTLGTHEIYVLISPYNAFLEENYTNSIAYRSIEAFEDNIPPTTLLTIGEPKYLDPMNNIYVSLATPFTVTAEDNIGGSGVASTSYRIHNAIRDTGWLMYTKPFHLTGLADGAYFIDYNSTDNTGNVEPSNTATVILDNTGPSVVIVNPPVGLALQDGVTFIISAIDAGSGVSSLNFSIREANGGEGTPVGFEDLPATYNATIGKWTLFFDTLQLPDGYYLFVANGTDVLGNTGVTIVEFSIRNWATIELLPASENNKAGRTMPVKFSLRVVAAIDPDQPFIRNEELTILIFETGHPDNVLQTSTYGSTARDYRIDGLDELYITNFRTLKQPKSYTVEIYRKGFLIGTFTFSTVK